MEDAAKGKLHWRQVASFNDWLALDTKYIINDEYVEFRKALAEGNTIQVSDGGINGIAKWVDINNVFLNFEELIKNKKPVNEFRIKPEEPQFKVGDFIRGHNGDVNRILDLCLDDNLQSNLLNNGHRCTNEYLENCTKWQPQAGELCWFRNSKWSKQEESILMKYDEDSKKNYDLIEPFLNSKPSWFKD